MINSSAHEFLTILVSKQSITPLSVRSWSAFHPFDEVNADEKKGKPVWQAQLRKLWLETAMVANPILSSYPVKTGEAFYRSRVSWHHEYTILTRSGGITVPEMNTSAATVEPFCDSHTSAWILKMNAQGIHRQWVGWFSLCSVARRGVRQSQSYGDRDVPITVLNYDYTV